MSIYYFLENIIKYFKHITNPDVNYKSSILNKDIDTHLISHLDIDDLRCLYQVNTYYQNLLKNKLANFIKFYSKVNTIELPTWIYDNILFNKAIIFGKLDVCQYIQHKYSINININDDESFQLCCRKGHIGIAKWLFSLGNVDMHADQDYSFRSSCENGHFEIAKWLYSLGNVNIHAEDEYAFRWSCQKGHINVAQWLCSIEPRYQIKVIDDEIKYTIKN